MSTTEITKVERLAPEKSALPGFSIERPLPGYSTQGYSFHLAGWVLSAQAPPVEVEVIANDGPVRRIPVNVPRPDVLHNHPDASPDIKVGFNAPVSTLGMTLEFELFVNVVLGDGRRLSVARILGRHRPVPTHYTPSIQPLMVNNLGRSGTTLMMRLLAEHPSIVSTRVYPYEFYPGRYWVQLLGAVAEPASQVQAANPLGHFEREWWASEDPFQRDSLPDQASVRQWYTARLVEQAAMLCQNSVEEFYREVAAAQQQAAPLYFAEKFTPDEVPGMVWELYPQSREIFLVRDFRDMLCSIRAFNAKRGTQRFNRELVASEEEYIARLGRDAEQLLRAWRSRRERACLVRYEELLLQPRQTLQRVLTYVGVDAGDLLLEDMLRRAFSDTPELQAHRTSESREASLGRWRNELDQESQALCEHAFSAALSEFGYSADGDIAIPKERTTSPLYELCLKGS